MENNQYDSSVESLNKYTAEREFKSSLRGSESFESKLNRKVYELKKELTNLEALQNLLKQSPQFVEALQALTKIGLY